MSQELLVVGVNHKTAPVDVRERLAISNGELEALNKRLVTLEPVHEAVVLSTCNRVEIVACCRNGAQATPVLAEALVSPTGLTEAQCSDWLFTYAGREAVRHVFRVASSLDSMVVGEAQILGQMKEQFGASSSAESVGPVLNRVFHKSFSVAKRVRSETDVASRSVSIASIVVDLARRIFESLEGRTAMVLGTGEMGELTARYLVEAGVGQIMVANRTFESAVELSRTFGGTPVPLDRILTYLPLADLVVGSASGGQLLDAATVSSVLHERQGRPVFLIDLSVPRNFDDAINDLDNAYLYDIDDLSSVAAENIQEREREAIKGEVLVEQEVDGFWQWFERLEVVPTIVELRDHAETIRAEELQRTLSRISGLSDKDRETLDQMTRSMMNKLLHEPTSALKETVSAKEESRLVSALRHLFGLGRDG